MCSRRICQSLIVSSFSFTEASPINTLLITLYKFVVRSALRIVMEPLMSFRAPSVLVSLNFQCYQREKIFFGSGTCLMFLSIRTRSNIFMWLLPIPIILHATSLPIRIVPPPKDSYMLNHSFFGHMWYVHPESSNQASENLPLPLPGFT